MRSVVLWVFLSLLVASPVISGSVQMIKLGGLPAQIEEGSPVTVGLRAFSYGFIEPSAVQHDGSSITIDLFFWPCPIGTCEGEYFDYQVPLGSLAAGEYTVGVVLEGTELATLEFEVVD